MTAIPADRPEPIPLELGTVEEWREWLSRNHLSSEETWLVLRKGRKSGTDLTMSNAVDEAICHGWIDSRTKRLDDKRYLIRFTPRKKVTNWSERNLGRARALMDSGRMTAAGISKLPAGFREQAGKDNERGDPMAGRSPDLEATLRRDPQLWRIYSDLPPGRMREFNRWVLQAKRDDTRQKRIQRTAELICMGRSLTEDMMGRYAKR